ncbi:hypothetical protein OROHE_000785 [Orobanche hederae]
MDMIPSKIDTRIYGVDRVPLRTITQSDKHYVKVTGTPHGWDVLFYIFQFIRVVLLFTVIVSIGTGWSFFKPALQKNEKKVLMIVIPLQVLANIASIVIGETGPFIKDWAHIGVFIWNVEAQPNRHALVGAADSRPDLMVERRVEVVGRLTALEEGAARLIAFLQNPSAYQELMDDKQHNLQMLNDRIRIGPKQIDAFYHYAKFQFECGNYSTAAN